MFFYKSFFVFTRNQLQTYKPGQWLRQNGPANLLISESLRVLFCPNPGKALAFFNNETTFAIKNPADFVISDSANTKK
jgi:hypothetical protein